MATTTNPNSRQHVELIETDGEPLDSTWHRDEINLLVEQVRYLLRDRRDYFVGGNMFLYFSLEQARNRDYRGPDFFYVAGVRYDPLRPCYVVWEENNRYPDVIIELLSPSTAVEDRSIKKDIYERTFRTPEYFCYDPDTETLDGWHLVDNGYQSLVPNERGWLWCDRLGLWLGKWTGEYQGIRATWLRFHDAQGQVVPVFAEAAQQRAETPAEHPPAEAERQRAESAEAEVTRLKARLAELGLPPNGGPNANP